MGRGWNKEVTEGKGVERTLPGPTGTGSCTCDRRGVGGVDVLRRRGGGRRPRKEGKFRLEFGREESPWKGVVA